MKIKFSLHDGRVLTVWLFFCFVVINFTGQPCFGADTGKLISVDSDRQKSDLQKSIDRVQELLSALKFQDARGALDLADHKLDRAKKDLSGGDAQDFAGQIAKAKKMMAIKEDSLISVTFEILKAKGSDSALAYTQNELRSRGVAEKKISAAEKRVFEEGPALRQAKEQEEIAKTVKLLESGQTPSASTDAFVLQSAQRVMRMRSDSVKAAAGAIVQKEQEQRRRQEAIQHEKEEKEKKLEEQRLAKQKKDEENKQREAEDAQKKLLAQQQEKQKQLLAQQERARKDSVEAARKIAERTEAQLSDSLKRAEKAEREKQRLTQEQMDKQRKAQEKRQEAEREDDGRRTKAQALVLEKNRKDSLDSMKKAKEQIEKSRRDQEDKVSRDNENRKKSDIAKRQEQARQDSIATGRKAAEQTEKQRKAQMAALEKARKDSVEAQRKLQEKLAKEEEKKSKDRQKTAHRSLASDNGFQSAGGPANQATTRSDSAEAKRWGSIQLAKQDSKLEEQQQRIRLAKLLEQERQRKLREAQKARLDSIETARKIEEQRHMQEERERLARLEDQRQRDALLAKQAQQVRRDSIEATRQTLRQRRGEEQQQRQAQIEAQRQRKTLAAQQEQARKDSIASAHAVEQQQLQRRLLEDQERAERLREQQRGTTQTARAMQKQPQENDIEPVRPTPSQQVVQESSSPEDQRQTIAQRDEQRRLQLEALQEKARQEDRKKLDADNAKREKERKRLALLQNRPDSVNAQGKNVRIHVDIDKNAAQYDQEPEAASSRSVNNNDDARTSKPALSSPVAVRSVTPENPKKSPENRAEAEKYVAGIYKLIEKNRIAEARRQYNGNKEFIVQNSYPEVISVLEQSLNASPQTPPAAAPVAQEPEKAPVAAETQPAKPSQSSALAGHEQESLDKINELLQDDKITAAYSEFKKVEDVLRGYLTKDEFGHFKTMIETAYAARLR